MAKKLKDLKWNTVALEGYPASLAEDMQGFGGMEVCKSYDIDKESKRPKKKKPEKKLKNSDVNQSSQKTAEKHKNSDSNTKEFNMKKPKHNGFTVEVCDSATPSVNSEDCAFPQNKTNSNKKLQDKRQSNKENNETKHAPEVIGVKKAKVKLGEERSETDMNLTPEDMLSWAEFKLPEPILKALTEMGFKQPTTIQQLTLPAAIHGRRDILGAAETGSGKTLAFGIPILTGIMKLKEKAQLKGLDVYDIPYKKAPKQKHYRNDVDEKNSKMHLKNGIKNIKNVKNKNDKDTNNKKLKNGKLNESSENGNVSVDESLDSDISNIEQLDGNSDKISKKLMNQVPNKHQHKKVSESNLDFIEEIEVPIRKKRPTNEDADYENDSDENYIHLSDMLDSDDLADDSDSENGTNANKQSSDDESNQNSDDENEQSSNDENEENSDDESENNESIADEVDECESDDDKLSIDLDDDTLPEDEEDDDEIIDENEQGIGCVKVIDDVSTNSIPGQISVRTGKPLYALILTPTRELAIQVSRHLIAVAKYTGIRIATIVGGMAAVKQQRVLRCGPEVVVATPGRLWELVTQPQPHLQQLHLVKFLAIDETDRMIERGHFEELTPILERLNADEATQASRQNFVFSATLTMVHDLPAHMRGQKVTKRGKILKRKIEKMTPEQKIKKLVNMIGMSDPKVVDITTKNLGTAETLTESRIACSLDHKDAYLYYVLKRHPGRTIVFCNSIGCVRRLAQLFTILQCHPLPLHASMPQRQRLRNLERFRDDPHGVLVATDVAARGLDIPNVDHVIHYQVPRTAENYVHRSGRTARAHREGLTILMMEPAEAFLYTKLCRTLNKTCEVPPFPVAAHVLSPLKELVSLARDIDLMELRKKRATQAQGWRDKVARDMDMIVDDDDVPEVKSDPQLEKALQGKKRRLKQLMSRPLFPQGFSFKYPTLNDPMALVNNEENALQVMKKSMESGEMKKEKRKSKNAPLLKLAKVFKKKPQKSKQQKCK